MGYSDFSFYLGLRKLAGLRSVAPAISYFDTSMGKEVYAVNISQIFHLFGCEMTALLSDCIKISYSDDPSIPENRWTVIKPFVGHTSFSIVGDSLSGSLGLFISALPKLSPTFVGNASVFSISGTPHVQEEHPYGGRINEDYWIKSNINETHIDVMLENFCRAFRLFVTGYYKIEFDQTSSALYRQVNPGNLITNPDSLDYLVVRRSGLPPWTPVDKSTIEHGHLLLDSIIIRCVERYDVVSGTEYEDKIASTLLLPQSVVGLDMSTLENVYRIPGQVVNAKEYETKLACSSDMYFLDLTSSEVSTSTIAATDRNIAVLDGSSIKLLRNRIFDGLIFNGPGDFVQHLTPTFGSEYCAYTVDMRNSRFYHCVFNGVKFGASYGSQLIMDGSLFFSCEFNNCQFNVSAKNMLFSKCKVNNNSIYSGFFIAYGSFGNVFSGISISDANNAFIFMGSEYGNDNNLFSYINIDSSSSIGFNSSFVSAFPSGDIPGSFSGNIFLRNHVDKCDGDPIFLGKINAHGNLFIGNNFLSSGKISLASNTSNPQEYKPDVYSTIFPYVD